MPTLQQYKCPCCDGSIEFSSTAQRMKCPYCDTEFDVEALRAYDESLKETPAEETNWESNAGGEWQEGEADGLRVYVCQSCSGEIVCDETTGATQCPYCGSTVVMMNQFAGILKPDYVIPFQLDKQAAKDALKKHYRKKPLLPKVFAAENHIDEVKGVYVPVWLFDADANAHIRYKATRVRSWSDSNYHYTETSHFSVVRSGTIGYERVPVDGSTKMDDNLMESIEPFRFSDAVDFQTAYLSGFMADKYDVDADASVHRAHERIKRSTEDAFAATVRGYTSVTPVSSSVQMQNGVSKYALYPVWLLTTSWKGKKYHFAMNGQTGKFAGDLPVDWGAFFKWLFGLTGAVGATTFAITYLMWLL